MKKLAIAAAVALSLNFSQASANSEFTTFENQNVITENLEFRSIKSAADRAEVERRKREHFEKI